MPFTYLGLNQRRLEPELMDDLMLDSALHLQALRGLQRLNRISFSAGVLWQPVKNYYLRTKKPLRVLDIASGAGDVVIDLTRLAKNENLPIVFEGCDFNPRAAGFARDRARQTGAPINFFQWDALKDPVPEKFDVILNSLFLHHLNDLQLNCFLKTLAASQAKLIVLSDLKRSLRGLLLCYLGTRCLSRSPIVHEDGILSVRAAFTPQEISQRVSSAGFTDARIKSIWPMRYLLTWTRK